jgi:zinc transport system ATP-binding protein
MSSNPLNNTKTEAFPPDWVVELEGVTFAYDRTPVLEDVHLRIPPGDFFAIIGSNGSAKTTLVKVMLGLLRPKAGRVLLFGKDVRHFEDWHEIGYVSQMASQVNLSFPATVEEVVASGYYTGFGKFISPGRTQAVQRALNQVGILELSRRRIGELSGGQRQRVFLAKALVKDPRVLFLDEPTTGVDAKSRKEFYALLGQLHREGTTIVMVTHDLASLGKGKTLCLVKEGQVEIRQDLQPYPGGEADVESLSL